MLNRVIAAVDQRLEESTGLKAVTLQDQGWNAAGNEILQVVEVALNQRYERLLGNEGQIIHDLDPALERLQESALEESNQIQLIRLMAQGTRLTFDRRTHRQGRVVYNRLNYVYLAAQLIGDRSPQVMTDEIIEHLSGAQRTLALAWGRIEWNRLAQGEATLAQLDELLRSQLTERLGTEHFEEIASLPLESLENNDRQLVNEVLGTRIQNQGYRQILLSIISDQWIDYLTKVEALRVSIGLEAYAQRDPLVMYKSRASEMFSTLLADIRMGVISRMFTYAPRLAAAATVERDRTE